MNTHKTLNDSELPHSLTKEETEKTKQYSIVDGSAYNVMYGFGEQYVAPFAIQLGATNSEIGILASVPAFIGSLFQIVGAKLTDKWKNRKKIITLFVLLQAITLLPLFIVPFLTKNILILTIIFSFYLIFGNVLGPAWNSLIGDVVSSNERAKYFSTRNKITLSFLVLSVFSAGLILNYFEKTNIWVGFGILFGIAFIGRVISTIYIAKHFEPTYEPRPETNVSLKEFIKKLPETNFGNFVLFRSLIAFAIMVASPFFIVYMLKNQNFTYIQFMTCVLAPMIIKVLTMKYWGRYSGKWGNRNIIYVSVFLVASIPLWWFLAGYFFSGQPIIFWLILLAETIGGFAWAGFELTTLNYMFDTVESEKRAQSFAYFNLIFGTFVLMGGLFGAWLLNVLPNINIGIGPILFVFLISLILRMTIAIIFVPKLKEVMVHKHIHEGKIFYDLIVGKPIHALTHQTYSVILFAEESAVAVKNETVKIFSDIVYPIIKPIESVVNNVIEYVEEILDDSNKIIPKQKIRKKHHKPIKTHKNINTNKLKRKKAKK